MAGTGPLEGIEIGGWEIHSLPAFRSAAAALELCNRASLDDLIRDADILRHGRGESAILRPIQDGPRLHLRILRHGGVLARLLGSRFSELSRPLFELEVNRRLFDEGAPVPQPAFVLGRRSGRYWRAAVATVLEEEAVDGESFLRREHPEQSVVRAIVAAGRAVRRLHDAGCQHADLQVRNLLVRQNETKTDVVIVDLDRARIVDVVSPRRRMRELMRLQRSLLKRGLVDLLPAASSEKFLTAYVMHDNDLRSQMLRFLRRERLRIATHALFYRKRFE